MASTGLAVSKEKKFESAESKWPSTKVNEWPWPLIFVQVHVHISWLHLPTLIKTIIVSEKKNPLFYLSPIQKHKGPHLTCRKIVQDHPRVIIWTHMVVLAYPMLHTNFQGYWPFSSREDDCFRVLPNMDMAAILVTWPIAFDQTFGPVSHGCST